jgi:hypothetical protein
MAPAAKSDRMHAGGSCRQDAWNAIFNNESAIWVSLEGLGNVEE